VNALLVVGCGAAGAVAGLGLDAVAARVPPPRRVRRAAIDGEEGGPAGAGAGAAAGDDAAAATADAPATAAAAAGAHEPGTPSDLDLDEALDLEEVAELEELLELEEGPEPPAPPRALERVGVAALTALLFGGAAARLGAVPVLAPACVLFAGLVAVSVCDIRVGLVPRKFVYPTLVLTAVGLLAASAVTSHWHPLLDAAIGAVAGFGVFFAIWFVAPRAMGFGDVRLAGLVGLSLGWLGLGAVYMGFLAAFIAGSVIGLVKMTVQHTGRKTVLPFGPALAVGGVVGVLWGPYLSNLWFHAGG
jgi:leader peptidase (prepilin peptidase)/N-methyltransferase